MADSKFVFLLGHRKFFDDQKDRTRSENDSDDILGRHSADTDCAVRREQVACLFLGYLPLGKRDGLQV